MTTQENSIQQTMLFPTMAIAFLLCLPLSGDSVGIFANTSVKLAKNIVSIILSVNHDNVIIVVLRHAILTIH